MEAENAYRDSVRERDLDNFLVEELTASDAFRSWILSLIKHEFSEPNAGKISVKKSPLRASNDGRQTDVQVGWFHEGGLLGCILIESKITDGFQLGQAESYAHEVRTLREKLGDLRAAAILVAPAGKMRALTHDNVFAAEVTIESIVGFLEDRLACLEDGELAGRIEVRIKLLEALAGKKSASGWIVAPVEEKLNFAAAYEKLAAVILPGLRVSPTSAGTDAMTRLYTGMGIPLLSGMTLRHEYGGTLPERYVNVQFRGKVDRLAAFRESALFSGTPYFAAKAGGALSIRAITPSVNPNLPFERERDKVEIGLIAIKNMLNWLHEHQAEIANLLSRS